MHQPVSGQHPQRHQTAAAPGAGGDDCHSLLLSQRLVRLLTGKGGRREGGREEGGVARRVSEQVACSCLVQSCQDGISILYEQ